MAITDPVAATLGGTVEPQLSYRGLTAAGSYVGLVRYSQAEGAPAAEACSAGPWSPSPRPRTSRPTPTPTATPSPGPDDDSDATVTPAPTAAPTPPANGGSRRVQPRPAAARGGGAAAGQAVAPGAAVGRVTKRGRVRAKSRARTVAAGTHTVRLRLNRRLRDGRYRLTLRAVGGGQSSRSPTADRPQAADRVPDGRRDRLGGHHGHREQVGFHRAGGERRRSCRRRRRWRRGDRAGHAGGGGAGDGEGLELGQPRVRAHARERGVGALLDDGGCAAGGDQVDRALPASAGEHRAVGGEDVADRVGDGDGDDRGVAGAQRGGADAAGRDVLRARAACPTVAPVPAPTRPRSTTALAASAAARPAAASGRDRRRPTSGRRRRRR